MSDIDVVLSALLNKFSAMEADLLNLKGVDRLPSALASQPATLGLRDDGGAAWFNTYCIGLACTTTTALTSSGAWYPIDFDTVRYSGLGVMWSSLFPKRIYAAVSGIMSLNFHVSFPPNTTGDRYAAFRVNGSAYWWAMGNRAANDYHHQGTSGDIPVTAGDYVECMALQSSTASMNIYVQSGLSPEVSAFMR